MINFRYHVVSVIGIFLALGLGFLLGSVLVPESTVNALRASQAEVRQANQDLRGRIEDLQGSVGRLEGFAAGAESHLLKGALDGTPVALFSFDTTQEGELETVEGALIASGARLLASVRLSERLGAPDETSRRQLQLALRAPKPAPRELRTRLIESLTGALARGRPGFVARLMSFSLATQREVTGGVATLPAALVPRGTALVFLAPDADGDPEFEESLAVPLLSALASARAVVAVGEGGEEIELLGILRERAAAPLVTADSLDGPMGRAALVLGLRAAIAGQFGHYGTGPGAQRALPELPPSPAARG